MPTAVSARFGGADIFGKRKSESVLRVLAQGAERTRSGYTGDLATELISLAGAMGSYIPSANAGPHA
jgi:hypothetical protein